MWHVHDRLISKCHLALPAIRQIKKYEGRKSRQKTKHERLKRLKRGTEAAYGAVRSDQP